MKRILAFIGSPRNLGNCEIMVKEISSHISEPHELRMLRLPEFDIRSCRGCYACLFGDSGCVIQDDFNAVVDEILAADAYIAAAPTYLLGPASSFKLLMDRWLALYPHAERLWGRPAVAVGVAGIENREGYTELGLESFLKLLLAEVKDVRQIYGALPGEIFYDDAHRGVAVQLAAALFGEKREPAVPACPVCGGATFRFLANGRVRCMLCSNPGILRCQGGEFTLRIEVGDHEMFTSLEAAVEHREWLKGMKERFLAERGQLKAVTREYAGRGVWVKPGGRPE